MKPDVVVDVGNSRIKLGRCPDGRIVAFSSLSSRGEGDWEKQLDTWQIGKPSSFAISGVDPTAIASFSEWLRHSGHRVQPIDSYEKLPIKVMVEIPGRVGLDRLLNAVAANTRRGEKPAIVVDAGSAVTVDFVDSDGAFAGGAIFPGFRLMTEALHDYTALLPRLEITDAPASALGRRTEAAIHAGVFWSVVGGIDALARELAAQASMRPEIFLTGGDAALIRGALSQPATHWPEMTLEGIRLSAETLS
jgi:type III pantothenate kinase